MDNCHEEDKPPSKIKLGSCTGLLSPDGALVRRFEVIRGLWNGNWSICPIRGDVCLRRYSVLMDI